MSTLTKRNEEQKTLSQVTVTYGQTYIRTDKVICRGRLALSNDLFIAAVVWQGGRSVSKERAWSVVVIRSTDCENQLLKKEIKFRDKTQEGPTAGLKGTVG